MPTLKGVFSLLALASLLGSASGQGSKVHPPYHGVELGQPQRRAHWISRSRIAPPGESAAALRLRAFRQKMTMRAQRAALAASLGLQPQTTSGWISLGPAPLASDASGTGFQDYNWVSGRATSVVIDPADSTGSTVLLGGAYGGLWRSTNALNADPSTVTWQPLLDDQPTLAVGAIAVQPGSGQGGISQVILVGTGETDNSPDSYYGLGILRSTDGGNTWSQITQDATGTYKFLGVGFSKIAFSTSNPNLVVAATAGDIGLDLGLEQDGNATARGLYWSNDAGQSWHRAILSDGAIPASATGLVYNQVQGAFYAAIRRHGIYWSTDGQHFTRLSTQPTSGLTAANCPAGQNSATCPIYRAEFAVTPARNEMYVWIVDYQSGEIDDGIWKTTNGGSSWTAILDNGITNCGDPAGNGCGVQQGIYNLALAAVSNGSATDLYAGAINLYKCTLSGGTTCSQGDWINLTHVYGCDPLSALAHVHPDQHGMAFLVVNGKSPGYFAHDGGISRTLDGYAGLTTGSCTGTNQFDSLSQTLGSMTEFVSFSQDPGTPDILLGGTQGNGSPKTSTATTSTTWQNALSGDGGYNAIDPDNPNQWFASNPDDTFNGFQIYKCELGTSCDDRSFIPVIDSATLGGDHGAFYPPYMLDPQNTGEMLVGTCRVWRVSTAGTAPLALSYDFETGGTGICTGDEINLVAALAAGGPKDTYNNSKVVYASTYGYGPLSGSPGGEVWLTTNAGVSPMTYVSGPINPDGYTISAVTMDKSDSTGLTAFVGIRGFHTSQVWLTRDGGAHWSDWTSGAALLDAPVNSLLVDSQSARVYAGTDVGVFVSSTSSPGWTEVGPAPGGGDPHYLPNAPVTAMQLFNPDQNTRKLRASTYGRGIWEFDLLAGPDFANVISNSPLTAFPSQNAVFNGVLTALNGYNSPVNLSCTGTPPSTCTLSPTQLTPTATGASYTLTTAGAIGDYFFNSEAIGTDANHTTHDAAIVLHVVDFSLTSPNPGTVTVPQGLTGTTQFQVTAVGTFSLAVTLSCSGLPAHASCSFSPSATVYPTAANPVTVTLTVAAAGNTPTGTSTVTIQAVTTNPAATRTASFQLIVQPPPDFTWISSGSTSHTVLAGQTTLAYSFTATPIGGSVFLADVTFSCSFSPTDPTLSNSSCVFAPPTIAAGSGATNVSLTITTVGPNQGTGSNAPQQRPVASGIPGLSSLLILPVVGIVLALFGGRKASKYFALGILLITLAGWIACGGGGGGGSAAPNPPPPSGTITVTVNPQNPPPIPLGGTQQFTVTVTGTSNSAVTWSLSGSAIGLASISDSGLVSVVQSGTTPADFEVVATSQADTTKSGTAYATIPAVTVAVSPATPVDLYANLSGNKWPAPQTQQFAASVDNASNNGVTWSVPGGNANGTIDQTGLYTAPATVPNPAEVYVTATSQADTSKSQASAAFSILQPTLGNFSVTVTATEASKSHSQVVTLVVQ